MFCPNCGSTVSDSAAVCPNCAQPLTAGQQSDYQQNSYQQPGYQQNTYQQPGYQQNTYQQPGYQQPFYQPNIVRINPESSNAKVLGLVAIFAAAVIPLVSFICGGIGLSKAKKILAQTPGDTEAQQALKFSKIGLIIGGVVQGLSLLLSVGVFLFILGSYYW